MQNHPVPYERLVYFQEQLGLSGEELEKLAPYRSTLIGKSEEFASYLYSFSYENVRMRIILQHERKRGYLKEVWANWFELLFRTSLDEAFFGTMWRSGLRHVEVNLDQRYINLAYCMARQFCHQVVGAEIPMTSRGSVMLVVDKLLDLCLLIETGAYLAGSSYCDQEVIKGISHQIRNPITVIGGNAKRLQRKVGGDKQLYDLCESMVIESRRLERLVLDIGVYIDLFQHDSNYAIVPLADLINAALHRLSLKHPIAVRVEQDLDPDFPDVQGDPSELETMFYYLIENSLEAVPADNGYIRVSSKLESFASFYLHVEIFNTGLPPKPYDVETFFTPFSSSKATGTGFGLPIAQLAARKNLARINLIPVAGEGTRCVIELPVPG